MHRPVVILVLMVLLTGLLSLCGCPQKAPETPPAATPSSSPAAAPPTPATPSPSAATPGKAVMLEGEKLLVAAKIGGETEPQEMEGFGPNWSGNKQLWWREAKPGDKLTLLLPIDQEMKYEVALKLTQAPDYGIVQLSMDGEPVGDPVDLYAEAAAPRDVLSLGIHTLTKGDHKLGIEVTGKNVKAEEGYGFGLDWVRLTPVD